MTTIEKQILNALSDVENTDLDRISSTNASWPMRAVCHYELVRREYSKSENPNPPLNHGFKECLNLIDSFAPHIKQHACAEIEAAHVDLRIFRRLMGEAIKCRDMVNAKNRKLENTIAELRTELHLANREKTAAKDREEAIRSLIKSRASDAANATLQSYVGENPPDLFDRGVISRLESILSIVRQERDQARSAINVLKTERDELRERCSILENRIVTIRDTAKL